MKVVGLDVCKLSVVACILSVRPNEPRQFYYAAKFFIFEANAKGIKELLDLSPDIAVFEPTGVNYSKLWGTHLARSGIEVRLVGHSQLRSYRKNTLELPDKRGHKAEGRRQKDNCREIQTHQQLKTAKLRFSGGLKPESMKEEGRSKPSAICLTTSAFKGEAR